MLYQGQGLMKPAVESRGDEEGKVGVIFIMLGGYDVKAQTGIIMCW